MNLSITEIIHNNKVFENINLEKENKFSTKWDQALETELRAVKYSRRTMRSYFYFNRLLCNCLQKSPDEITAKDINLFLAMLEKDRAYSAATMNLAINALKFFYKRVLKNNLIEAQQRPKQDKKLCVILTKDEIGKMLFFEKNIKHRLLLMLIYSSGLRVSEAVALKKENFCNDRGVMHIQLAKGRKDRYTILSEKAAEVYNEYCKSNNIETWIFPGHDPKQPLSIRSAQKIFQNAIQKAGITKKVSIHSLRHSFATHLLESSVDIRYIQAILGHSSISTTSRYLHIAKRNILSIKSPLDSIV